LDPIEVTFQDGDKTLRVKVPMMPVQLWQASKKSYFDVVTDTTMAVIRAISHPPIITYNPAPHPPPPSYWNWKYQNQAIIKVPGDEIIFDTDIPYVDELGQEVRQGGGPVKSSQD
jgi:hypothetical protein